ncbi:hypothetical protein [Cryobacterium sp. BB307]|uniref:hypothetical protein n=1 Tax=Cryobacterium sp. BB307 TaxID=2716317 RepID=UPI0014465C36|nr:hypothetical protein [Cryobacterium sp. BB307]
MRIGTAWVTMAVAGMILTGCTGVTEPGATTTTPSPTEAEEPTSVPSPTVRELELPESCDELVDLDVVQQQYGADYVAIDIDPAHPTAVEFQGRGGLACQWGIPNSDAGVTLGVATRATATDAEQVAAWESEGYAEGPDFLDETWVLSEETVLGPMITAGVLVEGYELHLTANGTSVDPLLVLARNATENMGYV